MPNMCFGYPLTGSQVPDTPFTAWGQFDYNDAAQYTPATPATVTFTPPAGAALPFPIDLSRNDGIWTAQVTGLVNTTVYGTSAFYTRKAGPQQPAAPETDIQALNVPPGSTPPVYPYDVGAIAVARLGAAKVPKVLPLSGGYSFPTHDPIHKAVAVVRKRFGAAPVSAVDILHAYTAVQPVSVAFGKWTALIQLPADYLTVPYAADVLFLDKHGRLVIPPIPIGLS